jgi:hypothetical protein
MKKNISLSTVIISLLLLLPNSLLAYDLNKLQINGFLSQGYLKTSDNNIIKDSSDGSFQLNEVGITFGLPVNDKLRIGLQLLARDYGEEGNNEVRLDWGFGDYNYRDWLGLRFGKIKIPIGLHNESRDSDFLRQMALLPQSVYDENKRNLLTALQGGGLYGNISTAKAGSFDYNIFYGQINFPDDSPMNDVMQALVNNFTGGGFTVNGVSANNQYVYGASLIFDLPIEGLRLGGSYFDGRTNFDVTKNTLGVESIGLESITVRMQDNLVFSLEYSLPRVTFTSEFIEYKLRKRFFGIEPSIGKSQGWYALLTFNLTDKLAFSTLYDVFYEDIDHKDGAQFTMQGKPDHMGWRKDLGFGIHYDMNYNWLIKLEYHTIDGTSIDLACFKHERFKGQLGLLHHQNVI